MLGLLAALHSCFVRIWRNCPTGGTKSTESDISRSYRATKDGVYLKAIERLVAHFNRRRGPYKGAGKGTDAIPFAQKRYTVWFISNRSGTPELWTVPLAGGKPVQKTRLGGRG